MDAVGDAAEARLSTGVPLASWMGWRLRMLVVAALLGCLGLFLLARHLADMPHIDATWQAGALGRITLVASPLAALRDHEEATLERITGGGTTVVFTDSLTLRRSPRWVIDDAQRARMIELHDSIGRVLAAGTVQLDFGDRRAVELRVQRRGFAGLPALFWLLSGLALALLLVAMVVGLARPNLRNGLYSLMSLCQAGNLVFMAVESTATLALPAPVAALDMPLRLVFDLVTGAAMVHATCIHPRRLPGTAPLVALAWLAVAAIGAAALTGTLAQAWWWAQGSMVGCGLVGIALLTWSYHLEPHPYAVVLRRFGLATLGTLVLLSLALLAFDGQSLIQPTTAAIGSMVWYVFLASLLLLVPYMSKSRQITREFSLVAVISTVATSLDLLFVSVFSLGQFASLTLSMFISLGVYSWVRQWILNHLLGSNMLTTERMFEQLYRIAREVEAHPQRTPALLAQLLRELFEPMEVTIVEQPLAATRVAGDGSTMLVPVPRLGGDPEQPDSAVSVRFAHRGRRLFTAEDARLTDRIVEQLRRAVAFDKAVEQGRNEERLRLAQDLHDDIGARLLTLMYKAPSPDIEDYIRHTLQDLKTLTRGLAAPSHRLSHAAAEWKADLTQRLAAAQITLDWSFEFDEDVLLSVVQWSALTRVLRELVSNAIAHSLAERVVIGFRLREDRVDLVVSDNGSGRNPRAWSHGLGLGGVRKRVKQLGGEVAWREVEPRGIVCEVTIRDFSTRS